jgi:hypothetical protein
LAGLMLVAPAEGGAEMTRRALIVAVQAVCGWR